MAKETTNVTRYLCASAHLNFCFAQSLAQSVFAQDLRSRAPSLGLDVRSLAMHALGALRRKRRRDAVLLALLFGFVAFLGGFGFSPAGVVAAIVIAIAMYAVVAREAWVSRYVIAARTLSKDHPKADAYEVSLNPVQQRELDLAAAANEAANLVTYSGYLPFVGYGVDVGGWSFVVNLLQGKRDLLKTGEPVKFTNPELYEFLREKIERLQIDGLTQRDVIFTGGRDLRHEPDFLPFPAVRPTSVVSKEMVAASESDGHGRARLYHCLEFDSWGSDLVVTLFYRLNQVGSNLLVETKYLVMPPLRSSLRRVDDLPDVPSLLQRLQFLLSTALTTPVFVIGAFSLFYIPWRALNEMIRFEGEKARARRTPGYDYGAKTSLRQSYSSNYFSSYFQQLDEDMYVKIAERQLLDGLVEFLDKKNIDTSDIRERQSTIMNNGVIVSGGAITGQSVSLGQRAKAAVNAATRPPAGTAAAAS